MNQGWLKTVMTWIAAGFAGTVWAAADPLPSWNDSPAKQKILDFVAATRDRANPSWVPENFRSAVFESDGTLWPASAVPVAWQYAVDVLKQLPPAKRSFMHADHFQALMQNMATGLQVLTPDERKQLAALGENTPGLADWLQRTQHPDFACPWSGIAYAPMVELTGFLKQSGYTVFIVARGGSKVAEAYAEKVFGVAANQVLLTGKQDAAFTSGAIDAPVDSVNLVNQGAATQQVIEERLGRQPIIGAGDADSDLPLLQFTATNTPSLPMVLGGSPIPGHQDKALAYAREHHWLVIDPARDFRQIFADKRCTTH